MAVTPWSADLATATRYYEGTIDANSHPSTTEATAIWGSAYLEIYGDLASEGVTISASGSDKEFAADIEALLTSAKVSEDAEMQTGGNVSDHTKWLLGRYREQLDKLKDRDFAEALGASVAAKGAHPRSLATEYPNPDQDLSDLYNPLPQWTTDSDL